MLGIKFLFFFYPDSPSVSHCKKIWLGLLISICMEATSFSPEGVGGETRKCCDLNGSIYHTCFQPPKGQLCERERERGAGGRNGINMCGLSAAAAGGGEE